MEKVLFSEEQRFTQWWLYVIATLAFLAVFVPFAIGIYAYLEPETSSANNPMNSEALIVNGIFSVLIVIALFFALFRSRLKTKITSEGLWVSFPPIVRQWKNYRPEEIFNYKIIKYTGRGKRGGHGIKRSIKYGKSFSVSGNIGLQLFLTNGKKILIGTQKKQALEYAMDKIMNTSKNKHEK